VRCDWFGWSLIGLDRAFFYRAILIKHIDDERNDKIAYLYREKYKKLENWASFRLAMAEIAEHTETYVSISTASVTTKSPIYTAFYLGVSINYTNFAALCAYT